MSPVITDSIPPICSQHREGTTPRCGLHVIQWMFTQKMDTEWELHGVQGAECPKDKTALMRASLVTRLLERENWVWMLLYSW